ncbi:MAG: phosphoethanolamine transferase [Candidatus Magnetominusculus sp. LBB02]|nr:phosphoethanolamine transferase [Candidatus Magnetominusculus sp. LBB02]
MRETTASSIDIRKSLYLFSAMLIALSPNIYYGVTSREITSLWRKCAFIGFSMGLHLIPAAFFARRIKWFMAAFIPFAALAPLDMFFIYLYKYPPTNSALRDILETNTGEAAEFIQGFHAVAAMTALSSLAFAAGFIYCLKKGGSSVNIKAAAGGSAISILVTLMTFLTSMQGSENKYVSRMEVFETRTGKAYPFGVITHLTRFFIERRQLVKHQMAVENFQHKITRQGDIAENEIYVLVIGEASRAANYSINGYKRNTTPKLAAQTSLTSFTNVCAPATETRTSLPLMLTGADSYGSAYDRPGVITFFRKTGFKTHWISNQIEMGIYDKSVKSVFTDEADSKIVLNSAKGNIKDNAIYYDEAIIPPLKKLISETGNKKLFFVLHTIGNHYRYDYRYPDNYDIFKPSMKGKDDVKINDPSTKEIKINSYDNSVLYVDSFLSDVVSYIASLHVTAAVVFMADHGEDVFDDDRNLFGHGNKTVSKYVAHIPLIVWVSDEYIKRHPDKTAALALNKDAKISGGFLFQSLLDMAGITYDGADLTRSIFADKLKSGKRVIFNTSYQAVDCEGLLQ